MPVLYVLSGPDVGKSFNVGDGAILGRSPDCQAPLRGEGVSRKHARLEQAGDEWVLIDLDSRNGLHSDGERRRRIELKDGQLFELGKLELRYRSEAPVAPASPAAQSQTAQSQPAQSKAPSSAPKAQAPSPASKPQPAPEVQPAPKVPEPASVTDEVDDFDFDDEIKFEGEELFDAPPADAPAARSKPSPAAHSPVPAPGSGPRGSGASKSAPAGVAKGPARSRGPVPPGPSGQGRPSSAGSAQGVEMRDGGRPVLQFAKQQGSTGFFSSDLAQYPLVVKLLAAVLAIGLFAAIFYFAYRGSGALKERAVGEEPGYEEVESDS